MDIKYMVSFVEAYIHHRKGIEVKINMEQFRNPLNVLMLKDAYETAVEWFQDNKAEITIN